MAFDDDIRDQSLTLQAHGTLFCKHGSGARGMQRTSVAILQDYFHRLNLDFSYDSICHSCFRAIGHAAKEADLATAEASHECCRQLGISLPYN
jgi:hypothetical protein